MRESGETTPKSSRHSKHHSSDTINKLVEQALASGTTPRSGDMTPKALKGVKHLDGDDDDLELDEADQTWLNSSMHNWMEAERHKRISDIQYAVEQETQKLEADRQRAKKFSDLDMPPVLEERVSELLESIETAPEPDPEPVVEAIVPAALPALVVVPRFEGWVKKKHRSLLWRWRYMILEKNYLLWWKRIEDYNQRQEPWGFLDFSHIPPHVKVSPREILLEIPGRKFQLCCKADHETQELAQALKAQEDHSRQKILREQGELMEGDLNAAADLFALHFKRGGGA